MPPAELAYLIQDSKASIVVADAENQAAIEPLVNSAGARFCTSANLTNPTNPRTDEPTNFTNFTNPPTTRSALIVYTSGTTGRPKGVVTTHFNLTAQIESLVTAWEWTASDHTLLVLPLHHVHGILNIVSCALWSGAVLEMAPRFESESTWERLSSGELTLFSAVPTVYHRLIGSWDAAPAEVRESRSRGCHALRLMMSGSAALPRIVLDRWKEISGHVLLERYGMTEVGMALSNPLHGDRRPGYVGQPLPGVSARIVDGELQLKGPGVFSEYWRQPDATREAFVDGWFRTGDAHASRHCRVRRRRRGRCGVGSARLLRGRTAAGRETRSRGVETMGQNTSGPVQNSAEPRVRVAAAAKRHGQGRQA
jgi:malonyl-CoA/methylmalonyl-CoA synthetase